MSKPIRTRAAPTPGAGEALAPPNPENFQLFDPAGDGELWFDADGALNQRGKVPISRALGALERQMRLFAAQLKTCRRSGDGRIVLEADGPRLVWSGATQLAATILSGSGAFEESHRADGVRVGPVKHAPVLRPLRDCMRKVLDTVLDNWWAEGLPPDVPERVEALAGEVELHAKRARRTERAADTHGAETPPDEYRPGRWFGKSMSEKLRKAAAALKQLGEREVCHVHSVNLHAAEGLKGLRSRHPDAWRRLLEESRGLYLGTTVAQWKAAHDEWAAHPVQGQRPVHPLRLDPSGVSDLPEPERTAFFVVRLAGAYQRQTGDPILTDGGSVAEPDPGWLELQAAVNADLPADLAGAYLAAVTPEVERRASLLAAKAVEAMGAINPANPADDPILSARDWLDGYAFRLGEAERVRHYPDATDADYRKALAWADDPKGDRQYEALAVLLDRIKQLVRPPYSHEVLTVEYEALFRIPVYARLRDDFPGRLRAWFDRAESFLSIGGGGASPPPVSPAEVALTTDHRAILATMGTRPTHCWLRDEVVSAGSLRNPETVGGLMRELAGMRLIHKPHAKRRGRALTDAGRKALADKTPAQMPT